MPNVSSVGNVLPLALFRVIHRASGIDALLAHGVLRFARSDDVLSRLPAGLELRPMCVCRVYLGDGAILLVHLAGDFLILAVHCGESAWRISVWVLNPESIRAIREPGWMIR